MENYYFWLSAYSRKKILLLTFIKSWKWIAPSLVGAFLGYLLLHDALEACHFNAFLSLITSFSLFAVVKYKDKLEKKKFFSFRPCYMIATSVILFWMMITLGLQKFGMFLGVALILFFISPLLNYLPFKLSQAKITLCALFLIGFALVIDFIISLFGNFNYLFISVAQCFIFMLFNAFELKHMDDDLQYGLMQKEIKEMTDNWSFDLAVNFIGMIFFAETVRLVSKIISALQNAKEIKKAVS